MDAINKAHQHDADYQTAINKGRGALASGDNATALAEAGKALLIKTDDADAKKLRDDAQEAAYQAAMKSGGELFKHDDYTGTFTQAVKALSFKPGDAAATKLRDAAQKKLKTASIASEMEDDYQTNMKNGRAALARGDYTEASARAEEALTLKPDDADATQLRNDAQAKLPGPHPPPQRHQPTNFAGVFGRSIPDLDFVWVDGIGPSGAYVSVNELSWAQYHALRGSEKPLDPRFSTNQPADLDFDKAKAFVDLLNGIFAGKKVNFRLPSLDEYKTLSDVTGFADIPGLVNADKSAGERFQGSKMQPREITADVTTNKVGLRNVIGNVREWTINGVPFGNSYAWGLAGTHSVTEKGRTASGGEQIGLRLICEPKN
jgi:tetratricopeptide (TPR) repeat protein